jgi:hypothetical protein
MVSRVFYFKYIDGSHKVKLYIRPHRSSRYIQYYTEHFTSFPTNVLRCYLETPPKFWEGGVEAIEVTLDTAKEISKSLKLPLVVVMKEYCNIEDDTEVTDLYYWQDRDKDKDKRLDL